MSTIAELQKELEQSGAKPNSGEAARFFEDLEHRTLRISAKDGRVFTGEFRCTDNECNVILASTYEHRQNGDEEVRRFVGLIVLPGHIIAKIEKIASGVMQGAV